MSSEFECLFRSDISLRSSEFNDGVKFVSVNRKGIDGSPFLQVRLFKSVPPVYKPTSEGMSLSSRQTRMLIELMENHLSLHNLGSWEEYLSPEGVYDLTSSAWIVVVKGGKQLIMMRQSGEGVKGISLTVGEYVRLRRRFGAINHIMFPSPCPKNVEITEAVAFQITSILEVLRYETCNDCEKEWGNQEDHDCVMKTENFVRLNFKEATKRIDRQRLLRHVEYLHTLLKCTNPLPTLGEIKIYFKVAEWYLTFIQQDSGIHHLLTSYEDLHE